MADAAGRGRPVWPATTPARRAADTVDDVKPTASRLLLLGAAVFAAIGGAAPALAAGPARPAAVTSANTDPLVLIGIPGLRWTDISRPGTPALWRLAVSGSAGSLVTSGVRTQTCPADGWLTLNSGARATGLPAPPPGPCPALPRVVRAGSTAGSAAGPARPARIPAMPRIVAANRFFHYNPDWGLLARAAGRGQCATAIGPGAALALAGPGGRVASYLPSARAAGRSALNRCPLTVIDLGALPSGAGPGGAAARARAVRAADAETGRITAALRPGTILTVAGLADNSAPHLRAVIVAGPATAPGCWPRRRPGSRG